MPDTELGRFLRGAVRQWRGEPPPETFLPPVVEPGDASWDPLVMTPAQRNAYRRPPEPESDALEQDAGPETDEEPREVPTTELGRFIQDRTAGWGLFPTPLKLSDLEALDEPDEGDDEQEPLPRSGSEFVAYARAHEGEIRAELSMSVHEYLLEWTQADRAAWAATGLPMEAQPGFNDLSPRGQMEILAAGLDAEVERVRAGGAPRGL